jgi:hypothetical protein
MERFMNVFEKFFLININKSRYLGKSFKSFEDNYDTSLDLFSLFFRRRRRPQN